ENGITELAVSPDGGRLASASYDKTMRIWDTECYECREVIRGSGDVAALAAGPDAFPYRAVTRGLETVVEEAATGRVIARFPGAIETIVTLPSGRRWAGSAGNHFLLLELEGDGG